MDGEKSEIVNALDQKLLEKKEEEEQLTKTCDELQTKVETVEKEKCQLFQKLMKGFSEHPSGQIITKHILDETVSRCNTLSNVVLDKLKVTSLEEQIFPIAPDEFTMMPYDELVDEKEKQKEENDQLKEQLMALVQLSKNEDQIAVKQCKETAKETKHLSEYFAEMDQEQRTLAYVLDEKNANEPNNEAEVLLEEYPADLTMSGLEEQIVEMYGEPTVESP